MHKFVTNGSFLAFVMTTTPQIPYYLMQNEFIKEFNKPRLGKLKYGEVTVPCSKCSITMVLISIK